MLHKIPRLGIEFTTLLLIQKKKMFKIYLFLMNPYEPFPGLCINISSVFLIKVLTPLLTFTEEPF